MGRASASSASSAVRGRKHYTEVIVIYDSDNTCIIKHRYNMEIACDVTTRAFDRRGCIAT